MDCCPNISGSTNGRSDNDVILLSGRRSFLAIVAALPAMNLVVFLGRRVIRDYGPRTVTFQMQGTERNADVSQLPLILAPAVPHHPMFLADVVRAPTDHGYHMIGQERPLGLNA